MYLGLTNKIRPYSFVVTRKEKEKKSQFLTCSISDQYYKADYINGCFCVCSQFLKISGHTQKGRAKPKTHSLCFVETVRRILRPQ